LGFFAETGGSNLFVGIKYMSFVVAARRCWVSLVLPLSLGFTSLSQEALAQAAPAPSQIAEGLSRSFEEVAETITPSVVTIQTEVKAKRPPAKAPRGMDPLREFFGEDFLDRFRQGPQAGLGTGVIVDDRGHILTNNHVIGEADEVLVRLPGDRKAKATVVGVDPRSDLAVIKVKSKDALPPPAKLGSSAGLKIGEWVVAVGASFGFENTITAGIVSAKGRQIGNSSQYEDYIQTDAAINPGNSGGPLVNLRGEVVGINTAIISKSGGYMGIGLAIPIDMAKNVMESLITKGKVTRGWLGVAIQNLTEDLSSSFGYKGTEGALVGDVDPKGPARSSGLRQGDIIVKVDSKKISNINQLRNYIAGLKPGTEATLTIVRDGRESDITIKVGELPAQAGERGADTEPDNAQEQLGMTVDELNPQLARRLGTKRRRGVVVTEVEAGSVASESVQPGDIITSINGKPINDLNDFRKALEDASLTRGIRLTLEQDGMERFAFLKADE
jgi:serine protease Do